MAGHGGPNGCVVREASTHFEQHKRIGNSESERQHSELELAHAYTKYLLKLTERDGALLSEKSP